MTDIQQATKLHDMAMETADYADRAKRTNNPHFIDILRAAYYLEKTAAFFVTKDLEPSRSILYRSAASLAVQIGEKVEAKELVNEGLKGNPPSDIEQELRDLFNLLEDDDAEEKH